MIAFLRQRIDSFRFAFKGIYVFFKEETHAKIHLLATCVVIFLGFFFHIATWEWCVCLLCIGAILSAEAFNSALERLTDLVSPEYHPLAGKTKDLAAGAVLLLSIFAAAIGLIVFLPKIYNFFNSLS
jgi:diacylglycerol kinase